jgi:cytochrome b
MAGPLVSVWDPLVRLVHWSVAALIVFDLFNEAGANPWHRYAGYAAGALVLVRLIWGVFGSWHVRLTSIGKSASAAIRYVRAGDKRDVYVAHNPLGACMVLLLWTLILVVAVTGWMQQLDAFWGDELVQTVHSASAYVLGTCAVLHVAGVLVTSARSRTNLVKAMITGKKALPPGGVGGT